MKRRVKDNKCFTKRILSAKNKCKNISDNCPDFN